MIPRRRSSLLGATWLPMMTAVALLPGAAAAELPTDRAPLSEFFLAVNMLPPATEANYQLIRDFGADTLTCFTYPGPRGDFWDMEAVLSLADRMGLKVIVNHTFEFLPGDGHPSASFDKQDQATLAAKVRRLAAHPSLYAWYMCDEPGTGSFPEVGRERDWLKQYLKRQLVFANLALYGWGNYTSLTPAEEPAVDLEARHGMTLAQWLDYYLQTVQPDLLLADIYPVAPDHSMRPACLNAMRLMHEASRRQGVPWATYVQAASYNPGVAMPTAAELAWQNNCVLAFGGKGIIYFYYRHKDTGYRDFQFFTPPENRAILKADDTPDEAYYQFQPVTHRTRRLGEALFRFEARNITEVAGEFAVPGFPGLLVSAQRVLVSEFAAEPGRKRLFLVNLDHQNPQDITLALLPDSSPFTLFEVAPVSVPARLVPVQPQGISLTLPPGEAILLG